MDADTTTGNGRLDTQMPGGQPAQHSGGNIALRVLLGIIGVVFGLILDGILLCFVFFFTLGIADAGLALAGWHYTAVNWLAGGSMWGALLLLLMLPIATALGAATIGSDPVDERRLRDWAGAMGIITGVLLIVDILVAAHLSHLI
jgi:hypothetical protein